MSVITRIKSALGMEARSGLTLGLNGWPIVAGAGAVTVDSAQSVAAVYGAVALISEAIGSLPLKLYKRGENGDRVVADHPLAHVIHKAPNDQQSATEFWEYMATAMLLTGNAYARIERGASDGQVRALMPLAPERVNVLRKGDRVAGYEYNRDGHQEHLLPADVFHLRHRAGADPLVGVSPIQTARQVIQMAQSEAQHGQSVWDNGTKASGFVSMPGALKPDQRIALANSWQTQNAGAANAGKVTFLDGGATYHPISLSLVDSQFLESRQFSVQEVARIFKIPPMMLADMTGTNYSVSTEMNRWFCTHTLARHLSAIEGAITRQLLTPVSARTLYPEFSLEGLLRGASSERASFYSSAIASGWMLPSEARRLENMSVIDGLDDVVTATRPVAPFGAYPSKQ